MHPSMTHESDVVPGETAGGCHGSGKTEPMQVGDEVRWKPASSHVEFPAVPFPSRRVFALVGEEKLRALVARHHQLLKASPVGHLFPADPQRFQAGVEKTADFIIEATGGPAGFTAVFGHTCMRSRHFTFTIDERAREIWLALLLLAFDDVGFPQAAREEYWDWVEALSIRVINRRTMRAAPERYPLAQAAQGLAAYMAEAGACPS